MSLLHNQMIVKIQMSATRRATIEIIDDVVTRATPAFRWAIGKSGSKTLTWAVKRGMRLEELDHETPELKDLPTDSEIIKKVTP